MSRAAFRYILKKGNDGKQYKLFLLLRQVRKCLPYSPFVCISCHDLHVQVVKVKIGILLSDDLHQSTEVGVGTAPLIGELLVDAHGFTAVIVAHSPALQDVLKYLAFVLYELVKGQAVLIRS